jgi:hypothetical protein
MYKKVGFSINVVTRNVIEGTCLNMLVIDKSKDFVKVLYLIPNGKYMR